MLPRRVATSGIDANVTISFSVSDMDPRLLSMLPRRTVTSRGVPSRRHAVREMVAHAPMSDDGDAREPGSTKECVDKDLASRRSRTRTSMDMLPR